MSNDYAVELKGVSKIYKLKNNDANSKNKKNSEFYALKDINFSVRKGEVVGILGTNGSGKSTLSSILAGISTADKGTVKINGEQALIAINTGLNNQLTGLENIKVKGALLGLSKKRIEEITQGVIEFAELGDFLYQPVKKYSSGMKSRLGFSISIYLNPDIIIIDEALSVGDSGFSAKCVKKIKEFKEEGKTIFFISHSSRQVKEFCDKGLWIEGGLLKEYGDVEDVVTNYERYVSEHKKKSKEEQEKIREEIFNNRKVIKKNKKNKHQKKLKMKFSKVKKGTIVAFIIISIFIAAIGGIFIFKNREKDIENPVVANKALNYMFLIEGNSATEYVDDHRQYLNDVTDNTIGTLLSLQVKLDGSITITKIPPTIQVYYEKLKLADEIRFINLLAENIDNKKDIMSTKIGKKPDEIITIKQESLNVFLKSLGFNVSKDTDLVKYEVNNNIIELKSNIYTEENNTTEVVKLIIEQLKHQSEEDIEEYLSALLVGNSENAIIQVLNGIKSILSDGVYENINYKYEATNIYEKKLYELIEDEAMIVRFKSEMMEKVLVYSKEEELNNNVYFKVVQSIIAEIINEESDTQDGDESINDVNNSGNNNTNYPSNNRPGTGGGQPSNPPGGNPPIIDPPVVDPPVVDPPVVDPPVVDPPVVDPPVVDPPVIDPPVIDPPVLE